MRGNETERIRPPLARAGSRAGARGYAPRRGRALWFAVLVALGLGMAGYGLATAERARVAEAAARAVEARLRATLGRAYLELEQPAPARAQLERSAELYEALHAADPSAGHDRTLADVRARLDAAPDPASER